MRACLELCSPTLRALDASEFPSRRTQLLYLKGDLHPATFCIYLSCGQLFSYYEGLTAHGKPDPKTRMHGVSPACSNLLSVLWLISTSQLSVIPFPLQHLFLMACPMIAQEQHQQASKVGDTCITSAPAAEGAGKQACTCTARQEGRRKWYQRCSWCEQQQTPARQEASEVQCSTRLEGCQCKQQRCGLCQKAGAQVAVSEQGGGNRVLQSNPGVHMCLDGSHMPAQSFRQQSSNYCHSGIWCKVQDQTNAICILQGMLWLTAIVSILYKCLGL